MVFSNLNMLYHLSFIHDGGSVMNFGGKSYIEDDFFLAFY